MIDRIILIYPSARPALIAAALQRARQTATVPICAAVGYNGSPQPLVDTDLTCFTAFGPDLRCPGFVAVTNLTYARACERYAPTPHELLGFWSDDFWPEPEWDTQLLAAAKQCDGPCLIQPFDGVRDSAVLATVPFATRSWWDGYNGSCIWPPIYQRYFVDNDIALRALRDGQLVYARQARIIHHHFVNAGRKRDWLDDLGMAHYVEDEQVFAARRQQIVQGERVTW